MQQDVAQLLTEMNRILLVDGLSGLIGFLQKVPADALMRLDAVPWAAVRGTQYLYQLTKIVKIIAQFAIKIYHTFPFCASPDGVFCRDFFSKLPPDFGGFVRIRMVWIILPRRWG